MIRTDPNSNKWILNLSESSERLSRWRLRLSEIDFEVVHRAEVKQQTADDLPRLPTDGADTTALKDALPLPVLHTTATSSTSVYFIDTKSDEHFYSLTIEYSAQPQEVSYTPTVPASEEFIRKQSQDT